MVNDWNRSEESVIGDDTNATIARHLIKVDMVE